MSPEPVFWSLVATKVAVDLTKDLLGASARAVRRRFVRPEARKALEDSVHTALESSLAVFQDEDEQHLRGLLEEFLRHEQVVDELAHLIDPRPDTELDFAAVAATLEDQGFVRGHFPDLDLAGFLHEFAREFYAAAAQKSELQEALKIRILGDLLGEAVRTTKAAQQTAENTGLMAAEMAELNENVKRVLDGGSNKQLFQVVQFFVGGGTLPALHGYEALVAALGNQGLALNLNPAGDVLEIEGTTLGDEKALPPARRNALESAAMELRRAVVGHRPTEDELPALEKRYREHLVRWFGNLTFQGMMRAPRPIVLPLERVYVELRAVAEVPEAADAFSVDERRLLLELEDDEGRVDHDRERELMSQLDALRRERWSRTLPDRRSIAEALHGPGQRAFVILGDPGSGKTTLLHYLALVYARGAQAASERLGAPESEVDRLPIFAPLAAFDDMRSRRPGLTLREFLPLYYDTRRGLPGLGLLFERAISSGRALVLLDGLDEVIDVQTRRFVAEQVSALMGEWTPRGVRFALSSRVVGYREAPVSGKVSTLTVLDFGDREIRTFVRQWSRAFEVWAAGEETPEVLRQARALENDLMEDVGSNASVRRLAANPLMLTMLALLRRQTGIRLPHRRIELYESYVKTLLENWVYTRSLDAREQSLDLLDRHQAENVLIPLALWLQQEKPSGTAGQAEIHRKLTEICLEEEVLTREEADRKQVREAEATATRFLREMREMSGLIVERGHDAFGFLHLTFQEYFAGRALAQKSGGERWEIVRDHLHDPRWREPLMLCAGRLGVVENRREEVSGLVRSILDCEDPSEADLHRHLLLALAIACDDVYLDPQLVERLVASAVGCLPTKVYALGRAVMGFLGQLAVNGATNVERCFGPVWECEDGRLRWDAVDVLGRFASDAGVWKCLLGRLSDRDWNVFEAALQALSSQVEGDEDEDIRNALIDKLNDGHYRVRRSVVNALSSQVERDEDIRNALIDKLNDDVHHVRQSAVNALSSQVERDEDVRNALVDKLNDDVYHVRQSVVNALSSQVERDEDIRNALIDKLNDDDHHVRQSVMNALSSQVESDEDVRNALIDKLNDNKRHFRSSAVNALSSQVESDKDVRNAMIDKLNDEDTYVRQCAVNALSSRVESDKDVRNAMIDKLNDDNKYIRLSAISVLSSLVESDEDVRNAMIDKLNDDDAYVRQSVVSALSSQVESDEDVRNALVDKLDDDDDVVRQTSLRGLARLLFTHPQILGAFQEKRHDGSWAVRQIVAEVVGELCTDEEHLKMIHEILFDVTSAEAAQCVAGIRHALVARVDDDHYDVHPSAESALPIRVESDEDIRNALIDKLNEVFPVRLKDAEELFDRSQDPDLSWLSVDVRTSDHYLFDKDWPRQVQKQAAERLGKTLPQNPDLRDQVLDLLSDVRWSARLGAALTLLSWPGGPPEEVFDRIDQSLNDLRGLESYPARLTAASFLVNRNEYCTDAVEVCLGALDYGTQPWEYLPESPGIRKQAALVLGKLEPLRYDERVYEKLMRVLREDEDGDVRDAAYHALVRLARVRDERGEGLL